MISESQKKAQEKYDKKNMKTYSVKMPIEIYENMMKEVEKKNTNRNAYTIKSIKEKIKKDSGKDL